MAARKPEYLHRLQGTYQHSRHSAREAKALRTGNHKRTVPQWLPDEVKAVYRRLMVCLPPLDAVEETTLSQLAILRHRLEQDTDSFTASDHSQLRQLNSTVNEWVKDYRAAKQQEQDGTSDFDTWCSNRHKSDNEELPKIPDLPCIRRASK